VVIGFFAYHAVPTNFRALEFRARIKGLWLRTRRRRGQKDQTNWERITKLADDFLPQAHSILGPISASLSRTQVGRRVRESRTYGVVRGAPSNGCPTTIKCGNRARSGEMLQSFARYRGREFDVGEFPLGGNHVKVGCKLVTFGAVSRAAITASTVIDAIRIINSDTGQVAP